MASAGRCFSPLSVFQTPPIKEEESVPAAAAEACDPRKVLTSDLILCDYTIITACHMEVVGSNSG